MKILTYFETTPPDNKPRMSQGGHESDADFTPPPVDLSEVRRRVGFSAVRHPIFTLAAMIVPVGQILEALRPPQDMPEDEADDYEELIDNTRDFLAHIELCLDALSGDPMFGNYKKWLSFAEITYLTGQYVLKDSEGLYADGTLNELERGEFMEELHESSMLVCDAFDRAMLATLLPSQRRAPFQLGMLASIPAGHDSPN
ncbi:MAG TPA: hypothetical protein VL737_02935 [Candidatus Pristimantibacillus sp.]|nr:hypothetical protein [Candidatus Pristimantibacillus sp.]